MMRIGAGQRVIKIANRFLKPESPGLAYIVTGAGGAIFEHAGGLADISGRVPMSVSTTQSAFSMTKTLTAVAVLQLAERGSLRLDDEARAYVGHPYNPGITVRHLLTHTAGIPNPIPLRWVHAADRHAGFDERAALALVLARSGAPKSKPGQRYHYSNIGYWLLGQVIESASQTGYAAYMRERVFEPLGLGPGDIDYTIASPRDHAKGYLAAWSLLNILKGFLMEHEAWGSYEGRWLRIRDVYPNGPAFGGAIGSAAAFGAILRDLLKAEPVLLSKGTRALLYDRARDNSGRALGMTLGWHVGELDGRPYFFKEGGGAGFHCEMRTYPDKGLGSVIMVNRTSFGSNSVLSELDREFLI
jgi:D-alanyl-D-alanine carboxypeptidase